MANTLGSWTIALVGNPNTGKSTIFNLLSGLRQRVGNYPGVTVEKKQGSFTHAGHTVQVIDLPGTYSLAPHSPDEMVTVDVLLGRRSDTPMPDAVLCIVDASNLERNLYLVSQVLDLGRPTVVALNMIDVARERSLTIDVARLERQLGVKVTPMQANRREGLDRLKEALADVATHAPRPNETPFPDAFVEEVVQLEQFLSENDAAAAGRASAAGQRVPRYLVERLLLDTTGYLADALALPQHAELSRRLDVARGRLADRGLPVPAVEPMARYSWVAKALAGVIERPAVRTVTLSDRIDAVLTHRVWGTLIFVLMMVLMFTSVFSWATVPMGWLKGGVEWAQEQVEGGMEEGALRSLLAQGVLAGVGAVVVFVPQIFILFLFLGILEDCGYMARAAYLMDKLMSRVGLSGKSFIPLLSSFACAIPGVMATRVIENRRDRLTTMLIAPLMSCSARLPLYGLIARTMIPDDSYLFGLVTLPALAVASMYFLGIGAAVLVALALKKTLLRGETPPFVMELPSYKMPSLGMWPIGVVWHRVIERCWAFIGRAGTLILAVSIVVWAALYYPHDDTVKTPFEPHRQVLIAERDSLSADDERRDAIDKELLAIDNAVLGAYQRQSVLGRLGHFVEPAVRPLGWDWRIGCAAIASFPAREVVVGVLGVIFDLGPKVPSDDDEGAEDRQRMDDAIRGATWEDGSGRRLFTLASGLSLMVFFSLCAQCASTLVTLKRESGQWRWPIFTFVYMTTLAYLAALIVYQTLSRLTG